MSQASRIEFELQSSSIPAAISHESGRPLVLQSVKLSQTSSVPLLSQSTPRRLTAPMASRSKPVPLPEPPVPAPSMRTYLTALTPVPAAARSYDRAKLSFVCGSSPGILTVAVSEPWTLRNVTPSSLTSTSSIEVNSGDPLSTS